MPARWIFQLAYVPEPFMRETLIVSNVPDYLVCAYRNSHPAILMVQSAQDRAADDIPGPLNAARKRGILVQ
jgi:hypothetical protein